MEYASCFLAFMLLVAAPCSAAAATYSGSQYGGYHPSPGAEPPSHHHRHRKSPPPTPSYSTPPPTYGRPPPSHGRPPPSGGGSPPSRGYPPPSHGHPPPSRSYPPPSRGYPPPSYGYPPPPSRGNPPPSHRYPPPSHGYPPPTRGYPPPSHGHPPPSHRSPHLHTGTHHQPAVIHLPLVLCTLPKGRRLAATSLLRLHHLVAIRCLRMVIPHHRPVDTRHPLTAAPHLHTGTHHHPVLIHRPLVLRTLAKGRRLIAISLLRLHHLVATLHLLMVIHHHHPAVILHPLTATHHHHLVAIRHVLTGIRRLRTGIHHPPEVTYRPFDLTTLPKGHPPTATILLWLLLLTATRPLGLPTRHQLTSIRHRLMHTHRYLLVLSALPKGLPLATINLPTLHPLRDTRHLQPAMLRLLTRIHRHLTDSRPRRRIISRSRHCKISERDDV